MSTMTIGWNQAKELAEKHKNEGGIFVRLANNGDKVVGAFCGEPFAREVFWTGERFEPYDARNPAHHAAGKKPSLKIAVNFFVPAEGTMKVLEIGTQTFRDVAKCREKFKFNEWLFEIERHGESGSTKTKYSVLPDSKFDAATGAKIEAAKEHDLPAVVAGGDGGDGDDDIASPAPVDVPIDARTASDFVARMKVLPRADVDTLLADLGVGRIRDLRQSDIVRVKAMLAKLEGGGAHGGDVDPFQ
jgi:hypothetical protein